MIHPSIIEARLEQLRFRVSRWFKPEINELCHILMDNEQIISLACGRYFGSFALLVATDQRLLLIDKRMFFMTIEDTRYDMISEIDYNSRVYEGMVTIYTVNKTHKFSSIKHRKELRDLTKYVQQRVMDFRQQQPAFDPASAGSQNAAILPPVPALNAIASGANQQSQPSDTPTASYSSSQNSQTRDRSSQGLGFHGLAQEVGAAAMKATPWVRRPRAPYIVQGSLMTRGPLSSSQMYQ